MSIYSVSLWDTFLITMLTYLSCVSVQYSEVSNKNSSIASLYNFFLFIKSKYSISCSYVHIIQTYYHTVNAIEFGFFSDDKDGNITPDLHALFSDPTALRTVAAKIK